MYLPYRWPGYLLSPNIFSLLFLTIFSGASLVSVEDALESQFIQHNIEILHDEAKSFWIGMHRSHAGL